MKAKKKFILTTSFTQKKLSSIISIRTKVTLIRKNVNKKEPNFLIFCNFGSDWDNWTQFFLGERCGQNKLFLSFHKNFYSSQLLRYLDFFSIWIEIWSFRLVTFVIVIWGLWFTCIWNLYPSVRDQSTVVVSNFLKKFEIATTFLFMAVHVWIFDILFVEMQGPRGTQKISVKIWGSWESQPSLPDTFYALDLLYDMPQWNFLMPLNQVELLHKMTLVNILIALSVTE